MVLIYTSYFYKVRFFTPNVIPLSTAVWDPKWYHDYKGPDFRFFDKRGVINGLRATPFAPGRSCENLCRGPETCAEQGPRECEFLRRYWEQLKAIPIKETISRLTRIGEEVRKESHFKGEPVYAFLVYEAPTNPCSERETIQRYFRENGIKCEEWSEKENNYD